MWKVLVGACANLFDCGFQPVFECVFLVRRYQVNGDVNSVRPHRGKVSWISGRRSRGKKGCEIGGRGAHGGGGVRLKGTAHMADKEVRSEGGTYTVGKTCHRRAERTRWKGRAI